MHLTSEKFKYAFVDQAQVFGFFGDYRFLSNFHRCPIFFDGFEWPSTEHAYMAAKCVYHGTGPDRVYYDETDYKDIIKMSCKEVKDWGQTVEMRPDWENVKYGVMLQVNLDKYIRNRNLQSKLIQTGDRALIEANSWGDQIWGFDVKNNKGENMLGNVLMTVRDHLLISNWTRLC
jgi:ribA/ribD-fused uncharacterized protein